MPEGSIEAVIREVMQGDAKENALDFVAHLRESGVQIDGSGTYWDVHLGEKSVCSLWVDGKDDMPGPWTIWSDQEPGSWVVWPVEEGAGALVDVDEATRAVAWAHANPCASCGGECSPGTRKAILGKAFDGLCSSALAFTNPDRAAVDCAKRMVDARMGDIGRV